jgi:nucleotide-binding universal stress UspA family protein
MYQKILVPIDGSETARSGLREAIKLGSHDRATVRLVHVADSAALLMAYSAAFGIGTDFHAKLIDEGRAQLHEADWIVADAGLHAESVLLETTIDNTGELLVKQAVEWPAEIIVMGTHGRRGLARLALGSNAEYVLRHTPVPVLLVRMQPASRMEST